MANDLLISAAESELSTRASLPRLVALAFVRAVEAFWRHGDLFSGAAISFYALFSLLPLTILLLVILQLIVPFEAVSRNIGRLFGGMPDTDILLQTIRGAYTEQGSFGVIGAATLILAATGVFAAVQVALDRIWECRGRIFRVRVFVVILTMAMSLVIFVAMLLGTVLVFRLIRTSALGAFLGWPRTPPTGGGSALAVAFALAQFGIFWTAYRFLPNAFVRWRDAWPGAVVATVLWHAVALVLGWYLARVSEYATLYHQLQAIMGLLVWVYGLTCSFLLGAEFVVQWTTKPIGR